MNLDEYDTIVKTIGDKIIQLENNRNKLTNILLAVRDQLNLELIPNPTLYQDVIEPKFTYDVKSMDLYGLKMIGIDGSIISKSLHGVDLLLSRAVAVLFKFKKEKPEVQYYPNATPSPRLIYNFDLITTPEIDIMSSLERLQDEIQLAIEMSDHHPDVLLLDGSILPLTLDKPPTSSTLSQKYFKLIEMYEALYQSCLEKNIFLVGTIKDTRSTRFMGILGKILPILMNKIPELQKIRELDYRPIIQQTRDATFLFRFLHPNERSFTFKYAESTTKSTILKDFAKKDWNEMIYSFYLKPVQFDFPTKIEFLAPTNPVKYANQIASLMLPLSNQHAEYGVPSVLIEADARAHLFETDLEYIHNSLSHFVNRVGFSPLLMKLRRDKRPFG